MQNEIIPMVWAQIWQVTLLIVLVASVVRCFGRNHPHFAHALWVVVLLKAITPPLWSSPSGLFSRLQSPPPKDEIPIESPIGKSSTPEPSPTASHFPYELLSESDFDPDLASTTSPSHSPSPHQSSKWDPVLLDSFPDEELQPAEKETRATTEPVPSETPLWKFVAIVVWLLGSLGSFLIAWARWLSCRREIHRAEKVCHPAAEQLIEQLRSRLGIRRPVGLIISKSRIGPAVLGIVRPTILIPARIIEGKTPRDLEPILAHELLHVRRGDLWVGWLLVLVQSVWWFHPLVWWAGRLLKREAERCCDEEVVAELGCKPARYARALLDVLELKQILKPVPVLPGVKPVEITSRRLERIMLLRQGCRKRTPWWCWLAMLLTAALTLPGAAFVATAKDKTKVQPATMPDEESRAFQSRTYKVGEVLEKIQKTRQLETKTEARRRLILHLKSMTQFLGDHEAILANAEQVGTPSMFIKGNKLIVRHSPAAQKEIATQIELVRKYGFQEIRVETRLMTVNPEVIEKAQVKALAEKSKPLKMAHLTEPEAKKLIEILQGDTRSNILQCPTVTLFNGQLATVEDLVQRPFVVDVDDDGQPKICVISEGVSLKLRPTLEKGQIRLDTRVKVSKIRSVSVKNPPTTDQEKSQGLKVQVPEVDSMGINTTVVLKDGAHVLMGGLTRDSQRMLRDGTKTKRSKEQFFVLIKTTTVDPTHMPNLPKLRHRVWEDSFADAQAIAKKSGLPILLHFRADWCAPCQKMEREVFPQAKFRELLGKKFLGVKIDIDQHRELAQRFAVHSIPMNVLISPQGKVLKRREGVMAFQPYLDWINGAVAAHRHQPTARLMFGAGVNSDSGVTGAVVLDERNFQSVVIDPPTDEEVLKALDKKSRPQGPATLQQVDLNNVRIHKEKLSQSVSPSRFYPMVGPAQEHKAQFKCTIEYEKVTQSNWPVKFRHTSQETSVVYIDKSRLVRVGHRPSAAPLKNSAESSKVLPAAYVEEDVQYFPAGPEFRLTKPPSAKPQSQSDAKAPSLPKLVEQYNSLFKQKRYAEAREIGLRAFRAYPKDNVAKLMYWKARSALKDRGFIKSYTESEWRVRNEKPNDVRETIEQKLDQKISLHYEKTPLCEVIKSLATVTGLNIVIEKNGLAEEGILPDEPVTLNVDDIKLSSALALLLKPLNLDHVIEDEVLKITGNWAVKRQQIVVMTYPVADLVVPISKTVKADLRGKTIKVIPNKPSDDRKAPATWDDLKIKRLNPVCDFDELITLIESTVEPDSWDNVGGHGSIRSYETTLSLVVRNSVGTHEQIRDLLEQLRRLRNLQVTLAVSAISTEEVIGPELLKKLRAEKTLVIQQKQVAALRAKATQTDESAVWNGPKITLFNGQVGELLLPASTKAGVGIRVMPVASSDGRSVRLQIETDTSDPKQKKTVSLKSLKDGHSVLVQINSSSESKSSKRKLVLITPRIIIQEEEEELLGIETKK